MPPETTRPKLFPALRREEETFIGRLLRQETVGGAFVLTAAVIALVWANSPAADSYDAVRHFQRSFQRGILDTSELVFFASWAAFFLFLATRSLEARRWRG